MFQWIIAFLEIAEDIFSRANLTSAACGYMDPNGLCEVVVAFFSGMKFVSGIVGIIDGANFSLPFYLECKCINLPRNLAFFPMCV